MKQTRLLLEIPKHKISDRFDFCTGLLGKRAISRSLICVWTLISIVMPYARGKAQTPAESADPRDIEQVYVRASQTPSWASTFQKITGREDESRSIAIVVGLSDYSNGWKPLEAPWYDARRVRDVLIKSGFDYVVTLTNKSASKEKIRHYMEDVVPKQVGENDRFIFYYSGHGSQRKLFNGVRGYLPMINSSQDGWSTMISMDEIDQWSKNIDQTRHSLFVLDSCFSGLAGVESKGTGLSNVYLDDLLKPGHFLITAGSQGQESWASLKQWGGSLFTDAFLNGIAGAADSGSQEFPADGVITVTKLYDYIRNRVSKEREHNPRIDQTPLLSDLTPKSEGEFFFFATSGQVHPKVFEGSGKTLPLESKGHMPQVESADGSLWPLVAEDKFADEHSGWITGSFSDEHASKLDLKMVDGKYRWDVNYKDNYHHMSVSPYGSEVNFSVAVYMRFTNTGTNPMTANLIFGLTDTEEFEFYISSSGDYCVYKSDSKTGQYKRLVNPTRMTIKYEPTAWNRMRVVVDDELIKYYLNSELLGSYKYNGFTGGQVGLAVGTENQGGAGIIDFREFEFRRKP